MKNTDPAKRTEALRLLQHGTRAADVARQLGVPAGTVRIWAHRAGHAGPPSGTDPLDWAEEKEAGAREAWATAQEALAQVRCLLAEGKTATHTRGADDGDPHRQVRRLGGGGAAGAGAQVRIAEGEAALIAEIIRMFFDSVGLSLGPAARKTLAGLLLGQRGQSTVAAGERAGREARSPRAGGVAAGRGAAAPAGRGRRATRSAVDEDLLEPSVAIAGRVRAAGRWPGHRRNVEASSGLIHS